MQHHHPAVLLLYYARQFVCGTVWWHLVVPIFGVRRMHGLIREWADDFNVPLVSAGS
jgi:hypothetical protein